MAVVSRTNEKCKIMIDGNDLLAHSAKIDVSLRINEPVTANVELYPNDIRIDVDEAFTVISGVKYKLVRVPEFDNAKDGFWVGEKVLIAAADYKGEAKLVEQFGEQFHVEIEGKEGTYYYRRHEIKKIEGDV